MSSFNYWFGNFWTAREFGRMDVQMRRRARTARKGRVQIRKQVDELEEDLGRIALLCRALAEVCIKKGVLTHNELAAMIGEVDLADGVQDGRLDPKKLRPGQGTKGDRSRRS